MFIRNFMYMSYQYAWPTLESACLPGMTKRYYALEMFLENLEERDILPHLGEIMTFLLSTISQSPSMRARELAISALAATGTRALIRPTPIINSS